jgi:F0F1-type ATP synthase membrane subunit c/vacuolar-type H+-ATPase subunit K
MDTTTIIAIVSIITAGLTTSIGCIGPAVAEGRAVASALTFAGTTTRCGFYHHTNAFCGFGHVGVRCNLLLCHFDDTHFCQPFLESNYPIKR